MKKRLVVGITILAIISVTVVSFGVFVYRGAIFAKLAGKIILKAGRPLQFGSYSILVDSVEGNKLSGITVTSKNIKLQAKSGDYLFIPKKNAIKLNLFDGAAEDYDPAHPGESRRLTFKQFNITIRLK